jgi:serine protease AprX
MTDAHEYERVVMRLRIKLFAYFSFDALVDAPFWCGTSVASAARIERSASGEIGKSKQRGSFRMRFITARVCCLSQLLTISLLCTTARAQPAGVLDPLLRPRTSLLTGQSRVVVVAQSAASLATATQLIQVLGGTLGRPLPVINGRAAIVPNTGLMALANSTAVQHLALDRLIVGAMERTGRTTGATAVREEFGLDGSGIGVAVIDSGITAWHDDLSDTGQSVQRVDRFVNFVDGSVTPSDEYGHGTHVAGIIAGNGFDSAGARSGIAPASRLVVLKVLDGSGRGRISDVIAALDYIVTHKAELNIRVATLSVATGVYESYNLDPLTLAAKRAVDAGIVVIAAAGNNGRNPQGQTQYGGITAPGNAPWVLTVGASSHMGTIDRADDTIALFSSRGPTAIDRAAKPDLVAPGVGIESLSVANSTLYNTKSAYLLPGTVPTSYPPYLSLSGTSMATPVVTGTVALMLQANPALTPNAVKAALQFSAETHASYDALTQGAGFLNAQGAVALARFLAAPSTVAYPSDTMWGRTLLWGTHRVTGGLLTPDANAWQTGTLWGGATSASGWPIVWGAINDILGVPHPWGVSCVDSSCVVPIWATFQNIVWGTRCSGWDCPSGTPWSRSDSGEPRSGATVVWGTAEGDTVVWGTTDGDTVVWGTTDGDTVVWGTNCSDSSCEPVIWPNS